MRWTLRTGWLSTLADLVWSPRCPACGLESWEGLVVGGGLAGALLCAPCADGIPSPERRCPRCAHAAGPYQPVGPCVRCEGEGLPVDRVVTAWTYRGTPRELVLALKFRGIRAAAVLLGGAMAEAARACGVPGDLVVPVPLSRRRRLERGYDQAGLLATVVAGELGLERQAVLRRRRHTAPQTGRSRPERRRAVRGAFRATRRIPGRSVLLVDDVWTTGGTAGAAAVALRRAGARHVTALVACRTPGT